MMKLRKQHIVIAVCSAIIILVTTDSCRKDPPPPHNPYDDVNYGSVAPSTVPDPNSIVGIHQNILHPRCAKAGCHDGHFEPDYRTVESSYATLVYHRIKKNSPDSAFTFRVIPYNAAKSVLHERLTNCCFVTKNDRMPQDIIGVPLEQNLIDNITTWIQQGARDMFGKVPSYPNTAPQILYYYATDSVYKANFAATGNRKDSIYYNPFFVPNHSTLNLAFFVSDDSTTVANMQVNTLKISTKADDFSSALTYTGTYVKVPPPQNLEFYLVTLNTGTLPNSDTLFMRYYVNDGNHAANTEFPTSNLALPYKTYWSFFVKP